MENVTRKDGGAELSRLLAKLPEDIRDSFSEGQLSALDIVLKSGAGNHRVDIRGTFAFWRGSYYFVLLCGKDRRELTRAEQKLARLTKLALGVGFVLFSVLLGLVVIYLIKSAAGINLFSDYSLGLWTWFKANVLSIF